MQSSKPQTFADMMKPILVAGGYNGTFAMWRTDNPSRVRSLRRALRTLIDKGFVIELGRGGRRQPFRYCAHPADTEAVGKTVSDETRQMILAQAFGGIGSSAAMEALREWRGKQDDAA
jgi:hypothetical protein